MEISIVVAFKLHRIKDKDTKVIQIHTKPSQKREIKKRKRRNRI